MSDEPEPEIKEPAYDNTLLLNGMWDIMEKDIKPRVEQIRKDKKYTDIDYILDTLPLYYVYYIIQGYMKKKFGRRWMGISKPKRIDLFSIMSKCNNIDWIHFSQVCDNMKYCPIKIKDYNLYPDKVKEDFNGLEDCSTRKKDNIFYTPLDKFNNDNKVNRLDKLNFKKDRLVIYKDILGNVKKGMIFKTNGTYGNGISILQILPAEIWIFSTEHILIDSNDKEYTYKQLEKDIIDNIMYEPHMNSLVRSININTPKRNMDVVPVSNVLSNTYEIIKVKNTIVPGHRLYNGVLFKKDTIS